MDNQFENTLLQGFSHRAQNEEFRHEIREKQKKKTKRNIIITLVFLGLMVLSVGVIYFTIKYADSIEAQWMGYLAFAGIAGLPVFGLITLIMGIVTIVSHFKNMKALQQDSWDGVVLEKRHWVTTSTDDNGNTSETDHYRITIEKPDGKKFKVTSLKAKVYMPYVEQGDRVRYHPGFPFPLELYDKSQHLSNICVFCGTRNDARISACTKCGKPLLI